MVSLDLQGAYLQVPVHPSSRHFLRFCVGDSVLQFRALCSGLSTAPQVFTRVMAPISSIMHRYGFRILRYLDDWLVLGSSFREIVWARDFLLWLCQELGVNLSKSSLTPSQTLDYLRIRHRTRLLRVFPTPKCVQKLSSLLHDFVSCWQQPLPLWRQLLGVMSSLLNMVPGSRLRVRSFQLRLNASGRRLPDSASVSWDDSCLADLQWWSFESHLLVGLPLDLPQPDLALYTDASDSGWGAFLLDDHLSGSWPPTFLNFSINHRDLLAVLYVVQGFLPVLRGRSVSLFVDNTTALSYLQKQGGTHSSTLNSVAQSVLCLLRGQSGSTDSSIHSWPHERTCRFPQSLLPGPWLGVDPLSSSISGASSSTAGYHRPVRDLDERSSPSVLRSDCGSSVSGHGRHDAVLGRSAGVCLPSFRLTASCAVEGPAIQGSGAPSSGSVLSSTPLVSRPSGASSGCPSVPFTAEGSTQTASLPSFPPEPPRASSDCVSYIEQSARTFSFTSAVAHQLARCRRASTWVNYQAKWTVFRAWCRHHGHSVSRPSIPKIASFLLYLRRSLSLSYSSIASYHSMLSGVFRFVLPELSSYFVLRDLLRSFRLERPISSSRVPPWEISRVFLSQRPSL